MDMSVIGVAFGCRDADNLAEAEQHALECGATKAEMQYYGTSTVMFDPEGHPFCLSTVAQ